MASSDETIISRVAEKIERDGYNGPDRRTPPPSSPSDLLKWVPLLVVATSGYSGYVAMQHDVERLQRDVSEIRADMKDSHSALWRKVTE